MLASTQSNHLLQGFGGSLCIVVAWTVSSRLRLLQIVLSGQGVNVSADWTSSLKSSVLEAGVCRGKGVRIYEAAEARD